MSDNQEPQENDDFEEIVGSSEADGPIKIEIRSLWDAIKQAYPLLYDGFLVRGVLILDRVDKDGDRELRWIPTPDSLPWETLGMTQQIVNDLQAENVVMIQQAVQAAIDEAEDDDEQ